MSACEARDLPHGSLNAPNAVVYPVMGGLIPSCLKMRVHAVCLPESSYRIGL
jgi:hypothetical protein